MQPTDQTLSRAASTLLLTLALVLTACDDHYLHHHATEPGDLVIGSGKLVTEDRPVGGFHGVALSGVGRLQIEQGGVPSLRITAEDNILPLLVSEVRGGVLELRTRDGFRVSPTAELLYELRARELHEIVVSGAGEIEAEALDTGHLAVTLSGAASVRLSGRADTQSLTVSGAASYQAGDLASRDVSVSISGTGYAMVRARDRLEVTVSGAAVVEYYGDPVVTVTGNGTVRRIGS